VDDHTFVHYAHLQHNSVAVKAGQRVRRGQVIGRLGNSGNTNGAHLHFNITDGPLPEDAQGLPFVFDAFESLGKTTPDIALGSEPSSGRPRFSPSKRGKQLPLDGTVVRFPWGTFPIFRNELALHETHVGLKCEEHKYTSLKIRSRTPSWT
jgi:murein DD-endopeptidase MepM/ murein hydrolase activator NlpD